MKWVTPMGFRAVSAVLIMTSAIGCSAPQNSPLQYQEDQAAANANLEANRRAVDDSEAYQRFHVHRNPTPTATPMATPEPTPIPTPVPAATATPIAAATPTSPSPSCAISDLKMSWPLGGTPYKDWMIYNYVDLDPSTNVLDYMGYTNADAQTYDGHRGLDIDVASFREMDLNTPVSASADGVVVETYADSFDRNTSCSTDEWNHVTLLHPNGFTTIYGHMKKDSIVVSVGQTVTQGQQLGVVGSSGCSTGPHVHLETMDCNGNVLDPVQQNMMMAPIAYTKVAPTSLMQTVMQQPVITSVSQMIDPGTTDISSAVSGTAYSLGMVISSLKANDNLHVDFLSPSGSLANFSFDYTSSSYYGLSYWWGDFYLGDIGTWTMVIKINGVVQGTRTINITNQ